MSETAPEHSAIVVIGETAAGVAAAIRAARDGLPVVLVSSGSNLGGVLLSLGAIETHYAGARSPFVEEFKRLIIAYYRDTYGEESPQFRTCTTLDPNNPMVTFEPSVATAIIRQLVEAEPLIRVIRRAYPVAVERAQDRILAVTIQSHDGGERTRLEADVFIDATDEGDLAALAGVPYRIGRESRADFNEPHAGKVFTRYVPGRYPLDAAQGRLNLLPKWTTLGLMNGSTGEGDDNVQDYSYRLCLTNDPANRLMPGKPDGYDREAYAAIAMTPDEIGTRPFALHHRWLMYSLTEMIGMDHLIHGHALPNNKRSWNATNFTGAGKGYAEADWSERRAIARRHRDHAFGILYFLQHDEAVPEAIRQLAQEWGLARDEFADTGNVPEHLYVREARRIVGRVTFTENDNALAPGLERAPIHTDSIAITEFPNDSLPCTTERRTGTLPDGQTFLMESSRPGQIPYRAILPETLANLLVPLCASVTHVAWGTARQTPTQVQIAEAAACAAVLAIGQGIPPDQVSVAELQRHLLHSGSMLAFFNEFDMATAESWVAAVQYLGTQGFFASYDARPRDPLTTITAETWAGTVAAMLDGSQNGSHDANARARLLPRDEVDRQAEAISPEDFHALLPEAIRARMPASVSGVQPLTRARAAELIYAALQAV